MSDSLKNYRILYIASTYDHLKMFHLPYIDELRKSFEVDTLAKGKESDIDINFHKKLFSIKNLLLIFKLHKFFKKNHYHVVILNTSLAAFICRMALKGIKNPPNVINIVHGYLFNDTHGLKNKLLLYLEQLVKKQTDYIITMNQYDYDISKEKKLFSKEVHKIEGMGVSNLVKINDENPYQESNFNLLYAAELSDRKNQIDLLKIIPLIINKIPNVHLTLIGRGKNYQKYQNYINKHHLSSYISLANYVENPINYFKYCDIYVSNSKLEGLPFNILNACEFNKPIIATNIKGHIDINDVDNSLYLYNNQDDFVAKLMEIYLSKPIINGQKTFIHYSFNQVFMTNMNLLKELITK